MDLHLLHATHDQLDLDDVGVFKCAHRLAPRIAAGRGIRGVLVLATCNRFELYLDAADDDGVVPHTLAVVADAAQRSVAEIASLLVPVRGDEVVHHLFRVASGLASAVVGEQEIRGQVRRALEQARAQQTLSPVLEQLGTASLEAARDVCRRTRLAEAGRSSVGVALDLAEGLGVAWDAARVVIAGTGSYAGTSLAQLRARGCQAIAVHSASGRADGFAERHCVEVLPAGGMGSALVDADAVVACRGTGQHAITVEVLAPVMACRDGRPLVIVDLALHRDVDDAVAALPGVEVITLDDVGRAVPAASAEEIAHGETIVREHLLRYHDYRASRALDPEIVAVRRLAEGALQREIARLPAAGDISVEQAARALKRLMGSLVHVTTEQAQAAGRAGRQDEYRAALKEVLGIETP